MSDNAVLLTLEHRVRALVGGRLSTLDRTYGAHLSDAISANPTAAATQLLSTTALHTALTDSLTAAHSGVSGDIRAGYRAAAQAATNTTTPALQALGHTATTTAEGGHLPAILADVAAAFATAKLAIPNAVRDAHDGVTGPAATTARTLVVRAGLTRAVRRLGVHVHSAAAVAVHRGYTDTQLSAYATLADAAPYLNLRKTWQVTSATPCPACAALHGANLAMTEQFDRTATAIAEFVPPPVHRDLHGPPRHVNCRCRLAIQPSTAGAQAASHLAAIPPTPSPYLSAAQVRRMPTAQFNALTAFLTAALRRLRKALRKLALRG